ncbi:MAG: hypothetical protein KDK36_20330, partial [Leptospiraceae bacterium]|nr:hypothetical protein [Leptospiraceae bacterium]
DNTGNNSGDNNSTGSHSIQLLSYIIDTNNNTSLYEYYITSGTAPSISHWTLGFADGCGSGSIVNNSSDVSVTWTNSDPTTGTRGIKFDNGYEDGEARTITILLNGIYPVGSTTYSIKAGTNVENGEINGPTCQTNVEPPVVQTNTLTVQAFMDSNGNGTLDEGELSLDQVIIKVYDSNGNLVGEAATSSDGEVEFDLPAGNYTVVYSSVEGLILANNNISVNLTENVVVSNSYELDKDYLFGKTANGFTIGFWKNNISKALAGRTGGTQIDASTLQSYVEELSTFLLDPLNFQNLTQAYNTLSSTSSSPVALLEKQLTGSEFNYQNGAYIGGNSTYTKYFLYQGEFMSKYNSQFSSDEIIEMKDLYDAYNNSHGGEITPL